MKHVIIHLDVKEEKEFLNVKGEKPDVEMAFSNFNEFFDYMDLIRDTIPDNPRINVTIKPDKHLQVLREVKLLIENYGYQIVEDALLKAKSEIVAKQGAEASQVGLPIPTLNSSQLNAIANRASEFSWANRGKDKRSPFEWVRDYYGEWIPGLLQSHLRTDPELYNAFAQAVRRRGGSPPGWLDVPNEKDALLRNLTDPEARAKKLAVREWLTQRNRKRRTEPTSTR